MLTANEVTEIFYLSDEFSKEFDVMLKKHLLMDDVDKKRRDKPNRLSNSEVMTNINSLSFEWDAEFEALLSVLCPEAHERWLSGFGFLQPDCRTPTTSYIAFSSVFEDLSYGASTGLVIDSTALKSLPYQTGASK